MSQALVLYYTYMYYMYAEQDFVWTMEEPVIQWYPDSYLLYLMSPPPLPLSILGIFLVLNYYLHSKCIVNWSTQKRTVPRKFPY